MKLEDMGNAQLRLLESAIGQLLIDYPDEMTLKEFHNKILEELEIE